jgi:hypothetical protein
MKMVDHRRRSGRSSNSYVDFQSSQKTQWSFETVNRRQPYMHALSVHSSKNRLGGIKMIAWAGGEYPVLRGAKAVATGRELA